MEEELDRRRRYRYALLLEDEKDQRKNPVKQACEIRCNTDVSLYGLQTIQGFAGVVDSRILLTGQTQKKQNGIYYMRTDAWVRAYDADTAASLNCALVAVRRGSYADKLFMLVTDDIVLDETELFFIDITNNVGGGGGSWGSITGVISDQEDLQTELDDKQDKIVAPANAFAGFSASGVFQAHSNFTVDLITKGFTAAHSMVPEGTTNAKNLHTLYATYNPIVNNSQENWRQLLVEGFIGNDDSGNQLGDDTNGSLEIFTAAANSFNKSSTGQIRSIGAYGSFGNTVDNMHIHWYAAYGGNAQFRNNVDVNYLSVLDYGFNLETGSSVADLRGFNITGQIAEVTNGINGYSLGMNITQGNYANIFSCFNQYVDMSGGVNVFGDYSQLTGVGNQSYFSFTANPNLANVDNYTGLNINPTVGICNYANGINVDMSNVTVFAGSKGSVTIQDLYFETVSNTGDNFTVQFIDDVTAGSESVLNAGTDITVHIESGVTTATQLKAAWDASGIVAANVSATITGVSSNAQTSVSPQNLIGGAYPGNKYAAQFKGNVSIDGNLSFTGSLTQGLVTSFGQKNLHDSGGAPDSANSIIVSLDAPDNAVIANADMIGLNTAALINIGQNATITSSFLGVAALGLPAVIQIGNGATIDRIAGALFALSLQGNGTGTIDTLDLCRAVAIPNGFTNVTKLRAYNFDFPFGNVGDEIWGLYLKPDVTNWIAGSLKIGGTSGLSDKTTGSNKFEMEGGDLALASNVKVGFYGKSPIAQPASSGAATASGIYSTTEKNMLQEVYTAMRALGLLS